MAWLSSPVTPAQRSVYSNTRGPLSLASRMTQASAPGRHSLNFRKAGSGQSARLPARTSVSDISAHLRTVSPPPAGSWLCPSLVTLPALPRCQRPHQRRNLWSLTRSPTQQDAKPSVPQALPEHIQVGGKQYTKVAGLTSVEREATKPDLFADVSVGPNDLQSKDQPSPLPPKTAEAPKAPKRVVVAQGPHYYDRAPQPMQALIDTVMLPFDFLSYPGRRDW